MTRRPAARRHAADAGGGRRRLLALVLADLARAIAARPGPPAMSLARLPDGRRWRSRRVRLAFFAPELLTMEFPAWDCLPYDRVSPSPASVRNGWPRCRALQRKRERPQLLVTTINAATQRTLTPFRIRQRVATLAAGERIDRDKLAAMLQANGYLRTDTVAEAGEFAVRGSLVDLFP